MRVIGLNGRMYTWKLSDKIRMANDERHTSSLHKEAKSLLREIFPLEQIYEEVYLPGSDGLTADFVVPTRKLIIEVQGEQHYHVVGFYHRSILDFTESRNRDKRKRQWAERNGLTLVELPYDESREQWTDRITGQRTSG